MDTSVYFHWLLGTANKWLVYLEDTHTEVFILYSVW